MGKRKSCCVYAVRKGARPGIYSSWDECKLQVHGFSGAEYKSFSSRIEAEAWMSAGAPSQQVQQPIHTQQSPALRYTSPYEGICTYLHTTAMRMNPPAPREEHGGLSFVSPTAPAIVNNSFGFSDDNSNKRQDSTHWSSGAVPWSDQAKQQCTIQQKLENTISSRERNEGLPQTLLVPNDRPSKCQRKTGSNLVIFRHDPNDPERVQANMISPTTARDPIRPSSIPAISVPLVPETVQDHIGSPANARKPSWPGSSTANIPPISATFLDSERVHTNMRLPAYVRDSSQLSSSRPSVVGNPATATSTGFYTVEYDGAAKGNPGPAGAGALIRDPSGAVVCEIMVGLGKATNNVAEYRGLIAGLQTALKMGVQHLVVKGDSDLVCKQVKGIYKVNKLHLKPLCDKAQSLMSRFKSFDIKHVARAFNSKADELANEGVHLPEGFERVVPT